MRTPLKSAAAAMLIGLASQSHATPAADAEQSFYQQYMFSDVIADQSRRAVDGIEGFTRDLYGSTMNAAASAYEPVGKAVQDFVDWKSMEASAADEEFKGIARGIGFELMSVNVGFDLLPQFALSFERRVPSSQEVGNIDARIERHIAEQPLLTSLDERVVFYLLKRVAENERYKRVQEIEISILPLPGVELAYDINGRLAKDKELLETSHEKVFELEKKLDALERELEEFMLEFEDNSASLIVPG